MGVVRGTHMRQGARKASGQQGLSERKLLIADKTEITSLNPQT